MSFQQARDSIYRTVRGPRRHWWTLSVTATATFMTTYDLGAVSMSLPQIMTTFKASLTLTSWVLLAQLLTATALLLPAGRLGDIVGRKKIYNLGFLVFISGSLLCSFSQNLTQLILFRIFQAAGASMLQTNSFAIIGAAFPDRDRGKGLGFGSAMAAIGTTSGPAIGGLILSTLGWRWIFLINVPVGIIGAILARIIIDERLVSVPPDKVVRSFDYGGSCLATLAIGSLLAGLSFGQARGWSAPETRILLATVPLAIAAFVLFESRKTHPLFDLGLLRNRTFAFNNIARCLLFMAMAANILLMPFYLQVVLGYSPLETGMLIAPTSLIAGVAAPVAGWLTNRISARYLSSFGMATMGAGLLLVTQLKTSSTYQDVVWRLLVIGLGYGLFQTPNNTSIMDSVPRDRFGVAAGFMNSMREIGRSVGASIASAVVVTSMVSIVGPFSLYGIKSGGTTVQGPELQAFAGSIDKAFLVASLICLPGVLVSLMRGRTARDRGEILKN